MLMTFAAFAVGAVLIQRRTWMEKGLVLLGIVPIAIAANVLRVTATGVSFRYVTDKATTDFLHDLYGWLMMPVGLLLLLGQLRILNRLIIRDEPLA
jgi:exosortase/archaeosortase family protein